MDLKTLDIEIPSDLLLDFSGPSNHHVSLLKQMYPHIHLVLRKQTLKIKADATSLKTLENGIKAVVKHLTLHKSISADTFKSLFSSPQNHNKNGDSKIILYGHHGKVISAKTNGQIQMLKAMQTHDLMFAIGPAGSGKTYTAVALAVKALKEKSIEKIILTRPAVDAGEQLGFLPGDIKEKLDPYLQPLYDALQEMISPERLSFYFKNKQIQIAPLGFMRGRTLDNAFVILDEAQNATHKQLKMFLTRMGKRAKFIVTGDPSQIDLPKHTASGLFFAQEALQSISQISWVALTKSDVLRHSLVPKIIEAFNKKEQL